MEYVYKDFKIVIRYIKHIITSIGLRKKDKRYTIQNCFKKFVTQQEFYNNYQI